MKRRFADSLTPSAEAAELTTKEKDKAAHRVAQLETYLSNKNVKAFLATIAHTEGGQYNIMFGGPPFTDYSKFPKQAGAASTAAGRYQILEGTYNGLSQKLGLADFSHHTQDLMAVQLLVDSKAINYVLAGDLDGALTGASKKWNSLPMGPPDRDPQKDKDINRRRGQPYTRYVEVKRLFQGYQMCYP